jgi:hypothetical protein
MARGEDLFTDVVGEFFKLTWQDRSLGVGIENGNDNLHKKLYAVLQYEAPKVEAAMKQNAPWTDQTGNARQGLGAQAYDTHEGLGIVLYQSVSYGIWLELAHGAKYAIILPTVESEGPRVMQSIEHIMEEI